MQKGSFFRETPEDLANELRAIARAARPLNCPKWFKLPPLYPIDFALLRNGRVAYWAEVKCRKRASGDFATLYLSAFKVSALLELQAVSQTPALLVASWTDCVGILQLPCPRIFCAIDGRTDRGGVNDIEPVIHFPVESFRRYLWESPQ